MENISDTNSSIRTKKKTTINNIQITHGWLTKITKKYKNYNKPNMI